MSHPWAGPPATSYPTPIAERTTAILGVFNNIIDTHSVDEEKLSAVVDNLARFRIWAGNIGAYHADPRSVDVRLRHAPEVAQRILESLDELAEFNEEIRAIASGERQDAAGEDYRYDELGEDIGSVSELTELGLSVSDTITSLLKVSALLRRATAPDRYAKAAAAQDPKFPEQFDIRHVAEKFPKVERQPWLRDRLGRANVQRRQYLRYARKHHDRLARQPEPANERPVRQTKEENVFRVPTGQPTTSASTHPSLAPTKASTFDYDRLPNDTAQIERIGLLDDSLSQTSSVVSSSGHEDGRLDVVQLSELAKDGEPFECPYCWTIVQTRRQKSWRRHVMHDIRAWTCTFEDCCSGLFEDRDSWFQHELEHHRRRWICHECPNAVFDSRQSIEAHIQSIHPTLPVDVLSTIIDSSSRPVTEIKATACPLCVEWHEGLIAKATQLGLSTTNVVVPLHDFRRHLGQHLEQLALFAIPPNPENDMASGESSKTLRDDIIPRTKEWRSALQATEAEEEVQSSPAPRQSHAEGPTSVTSPQPHFQHVRRLGMGTYAEVTEVMDSTTKTSYAQKLIRPRTSDEKYKERMRFQVESEVDMMKKLRHQHIATILYNIEEPSAFRLIMLPIADCDLRDFLDVHCIEAGFPPDKLRHLDPWFGCLATAVAYLHDQSVVHWDINPSNILIKDYNPYLSDFGCSKNLEGGNTHDDYLMSGTPVYWAPEMYRHGFAADAFALGCVFSEMLTVRQGRSLEDYRKARMAEGRDTPTAFRNGLEAVDAWLKALPEINLPMAPQGLLLQVTQNMLEKDPDVRYTARDAKRGLGRETKIFFCETCE